MNDKPATGRGKFFGRTVLITGASRGIGKELALKLAKDGANIVVAAKTATAHPTLPGTIYTAAEEIEKAGGKALPCIVDVRDEKSVQDAVDAAVKKFGGIDILINNASAISLTNTTDTTMKKYDLMHSINTRGTYLMTKTCLPYLKQGKNPHVMMISPPLLMEPRWFSAHVAYTMAKFGMSMCVLGMHEEFRPNGIAVNALWPLTAIWTAAMEMLSEDAKAGCRKPAIMADAAYAILSKNSRDYTGRFEIDEDVLRAEGVTDFDKYAVDPSQPLMADFFIPSKYEAVFTGQQVGARQKSRDSIDKAVSSEEIAGVVKSVSEMINAEVVGQCKAVYQLELTGSSPKSFVLDLKSGSGSFNEGKHEKPEATITVDSSDFVPLFTGKKSATTLFMTKKMKVGGDMTRVLKLDSLFKQLRKGSKL